MDYLYVQGDNPWYNYYMYLLDLPVPYVQPSFCGGLVGDAHLTFLNDMLSANTPSISSVIRFSQLTCMDGTNDQMFYGEIEKNLIF